jgi:hypothetical protein
MEVTSEEIEMKRVEILVVQKKFLSLYTNY